VHGGGTRSPDDWRTLFTRLKAAGLSGVHVGGGDPVMLSAAAHEAGLVFSRWTWMMNRSSDDWVKTYHPEWFTVSREGNSSLTHPPYVPYYQWLCPTREAVRAYLVDECAAVARDPGVDQVHMDYIRHCDVILPRALWATYHLVQDHEMPAYDFCYCDACREGFQRRTGKDPLALPDPPSDAAWRRFRWDSVTGLVREVARAVHAARKPLTAAVFPTPAIARREVRQAWDEWPLDAAFPMLYHAFHAEPVEWIGRSVREDRAAIHARFPIYAGLHVPDLPPDDLARAMSDSLRAGAAGVSLYEVNDLTDAHLARLATS